MEGESGRIVDWYNFSSSSSSFSVNHHHHHSVQFSSVTQSCPTLCDPMNCSTPGLPVHHQLPEFTQTHVHPVGDATQPSHPLSSSSPPALNPSNEHSGVISFRVDWLDLLAVQGTRKSLFQHHQFKNINSSALSFPYSPTLTSIHDYWKNHSLDYTDTTLAK